MIFKDRREAGQLLAQKLVKHMGENTIVLGIPRGGVPVAYEIAGKLNCKLDIMLSKKISHPFNSQFAIGAVTLDSFIIDESGNIPKRYIEEEINELRSKLREKNKLYRGNRAPLILTNKKVIIVDDGIATGNTLLSTIEVLRKQKALEIIVASPVVPADRVQIIAEAADEFVYLYAPLSFSGVGEFYQEFKQVSDEEVIELLNAMN
mgnify:CR=1 FL=1